MRYLLITNYKEPIFTHWFAPESHLVAHIELVIDLELNKFSTDGIRWDNIQSYNGR